MSMGQLPSNKFDPRKFADKDTTLKGELSVSVCERLMAYLVGDQGLVKVDLRLSQDEQKHRLVTGHAEADVQLLCQRCLEPMTVNLHADYSLAIVQDEEEALSIPSHYDPLLIANDQEISVAELIEDELIVSMPLVPYHDSSLCKGQSHYSTGDVIEEKVSPFAALAVLKTKKE